MSIEFLNASERCITICFGNEVSLELNTKVKLLDEELRVNPIVGIVEMVPTYCALSVHFRPEIIRYKELICELTTRINNLQFVDSEDKVKNYKEVPVYYGGETGPDLEYCAELEGVSTDELIRKHSEHPYYVYQLGFSPGHPYMARFDEPFSFKRRETPRVDIPAHSVVVQQNLTNITPFHQPSGWNIIGSTPLNITDYNRENPFFFKVGDWVKLKPINKEEYDNIKSSNEDTTQKHSVKVEDSFKVLSAGALTTVQDEGRIGYQNSGVTPAGPMDYRAFHLANIIVGNKKETAVLECTIIGPTIEFYVDTTIAICGADLSPSINNNPVGMYESINVYQGDVLSFGKRNYGSRAYIAFAGGIDIPKIMGSASTDIKNGLGGIDGRALKAGDFIGIKEPKSRFKLPVVLPKEYYNDNEITLRVLLGPQDDRFTKEGIRHFFNYSATVTNRCDRQGIRFESDPIEFVADGNIISDGISFGAIQVPNDGKPIILMADRQSVGGYAKLGNVIYADLPKLAQAMPGCKVRFIQVDRELAEELYLREVGEIQKLEDTYVQH